MSAAVMRAESTLWADYNRTILRVGSTRIYEDSKRLFLGSIRMRVQNLYLNLWDIIFFL
jgi:hypothetical protein